MNITIAKNYNNYYNRIVKFPQDYLDNEFQHSIHYHTISVNFTPGDGVNTSHVVGTYDYDGQGDYLVVSDEQNKIVSRWFIIDHTRTRAGQYQLTLRRDLIADYFDMIVESPIFIEKATLPYDSPLLFNKEDMTFNQVLKNSYPIKDKSQCAWIVGYYAKNSTDMAGTVPSGALDNVLELSTTIESWDYYKYTQSPFFDKPNFISYSITVGDTGHTSGHGIRFYIRDDTGEVSYLTDSSFNTSSLWSRYGGTEIQRENMVKTIKRSVESIGGVIELNQYLDANTDFPSATEVNTFLSLNGKLIRDFDGKVFKVYINQEGTFDRKYNITSGNLYNKFNDIVLNTQNQGIANSTPIYGTANEESYKIQAQSNYYNIKLVRQENLETNYDITGGVVINTEDSPYNIFAIPYGEITIKNLSGETICQTNEAVSMRTAQAIQTQQQSKLFDIQLLPYCPLQSLIKETGVMYVDDTQQTGLYSLIKDGEDNAYGIIFNISRGRFSFNITSDIWGNIPQSNTNIGVKINNECKKYRLCSPNYSNYFDFSGEMNYGVNYFNVDCDYKPYTPYIHINPNFGGLYGYDDNSPRGLVLGGDFSLTAIGDAWVQYQINNKNFQNIFDRQIQNMEVQHKYQRIQDYANMFAGTMQGATSGAMTGSLAGPGGAIAGGIVGGISSLAGGIADISINEKLRNEALDYTKDMFGYQLGNIQALPQTISKVSAFNNNNKLFPVLETYECTEKELEAFLYKLAYNGMTTMIIGKLSDYIYRNEWTYNEIESKGYIKGKLIRLEGTGESFNVINAISGELDKGVYIK